MSVYVDPLVEYEKRPGWPYNEACHLSADTDDELHDFAARLGLKRRWAQKMNHPRQWHHHYDLTKNKRRQAVKLGAIEVDHGEPYGAWLAEHTEEQA
jgi:hypothetical protein